LVVDGDGKEGAICAIKAPDYLWGAGGDAGKQRVTAGCACLIQRMGFRRPAIETHNITKLDDVVDSSRTRKWLHAVWATQDSVKRLSNEADKRQELHHTWYLVVADGRGGPTSRVDPSNEAGEE